MVLQIILLKNKTCKLLLSFEDLSSLQSPIFVRVHGLSRICHVLTSNEKVECLLSMNLKPSGLSFWAEVGFLLVTSVFGVRCYWIPQPLDAVACVVCLHSVIIWIQEKFGWSMRGLPMKGENCWSCWLIEDLS